MIALQTELPDIGGGYMAAKVLHKTMAFTAIPPNGAHHTHYHVAESEYILKPNEFGCKNLLILANLADLLCLPTSHPTFKLYIKQENIPCLNSKPFK
jgi:hypothetical protein